MLCVLLNQQVCLYSDCKYWSDSDSECLYVKNKKQTLDRAYVQSVLKAKEKERKA